jgi:spore coat protein A
MGSTTRRDFLKLSAVSTLIFAHGADAGDRAAQPAYRKPGSLDRYVDVLRIPRGLLPYGTRVDKTLYRVRMFEFTQQMHSQLPPTKLWGYEGQYPGPTIEAQRGKPIEILWENHLPSDHIFAVDPRIHGAMPPAPSVRTVPHLHGSRTRSESDDLPEKWFPPGSLACYQYPNEQEAATLWYQDHAVRITRLNVYAGLSGFFLLRDAKEHNMQLPSGDYEIPLILQDCTLNDRGQLVYCPTYEDGQGLSPGEWGPEFFGQLPAVNGCIYPYL